MGAVKYYKAVITVLLVGNLGKLEALRVTHQDTIKELKNEVASLKEKVRWLENEREDLKNSNASANEQQAQSIKCLEKVNSLFITRDLKSIHAYNIISCVCDI